MSCCSHSGAAGRFFSLLARHYRRRYLKKGLEKSQKQLVAGLQKAGIENATLLEIGCGVGFLHQSLLTSGAASSVGIDLSDKMLNEARELANGQGLENRTEYLEGDFVEISECLNDADVLILDKVVCCYPNAEILIEKSLSKTRHVYALTYPRDRWFVRLALALGNFALRLILSDFRGDLHDPTQIEAWIEAKGFEIAYTGQTLAWDTQVWVRNEEPQNDHT